MNVFIKMEGYQYRQGEKRAIKAFIEKVLNEERREGEVSLLLTHDRRLEELNTRYRQIHSPTDVLSFPQDDPQLLGDIVISMEMVKKRAQEEGTSSLEIVLHLVLHGLLHLLGYDHHQEEEASLMEEKEELYRNKFFLEVLK